MLLAVRSTSCAAASETAIRELVASAISNPSELVHGRDMASPRSCCYWPYGQGEAPRAKSTDVRSQMRRGPRSPRTSSPRFDGRRGLTDASAADVCPDISPELLDLYLVEHAFPGRHLVLSILH